LLRLNLLYLLKAARIAVRRRELCGRVNLSGFLLKFEQPRREIGALPRDGLGQEKGMSRP